MPKKPKTQNQLIAENEDLRARLDEAEETLRAIRSGEVDALVVSTAQGEQVFTLKGAEHSYRILIEEMNEGAVTLSLEGVILYCNRRFAEMLKTPLEQVIGSSIEGWIAPADQKSFQALLQRNGKQSRRAEIGLSAGDGTLVSAHFSINMLPMEDTQGRFYLVVTDLTEQKRSEAIIAAEKMAQELLAVSNKSRLVLLSVIEDQKLAEEALRASEEKFRQAFNTSPIAISISRLKGGGFISVNKSFEKMSGYSESEVIGKTAEELHLWKDPEVHQGLIKELRAKGEIRDYETPILTRSGEIYCLTSASIIEINGEPHILTLAVDITERKQAEEKLRESEFRLRAFFRSCPLPITISRVKDGVYTNSNAAYERLIGFHADEIVGHSAAELNVWVDIQRRAQMLKDLQAKGSVQNFEFQLKSRDGNLHDMQIWAEWIELNGEPHTFAIAEDITERKRAEDILRESERKLREAQEMAHLGFWHWDVKTGKVEWSEEVFKIFCLDPKEFTPQIDSILALSPWEEDHRRDQELINRAIETHNPGSYEQKFLRPDQSIGHYYSTFQGNYDENGGLISIVGTVLDITERKQAEEKLRASEAKFKAVFDNAPIGISLLDPDRRLQESNDMLAQIVRIDKEGLAAGAYRNRKYIREDGSEIPTSELASARAIAEQKAIRKVVNGIILENGEVIWTQVSAAPLGLPDSRIVVITEDITARKQAEQALHESENKYRTLVQNMQVGMVAHRPDTSILFSNAMASQLLGLTLDQMLGKTAIDPAWHFVHENGTTLSLDEYPVNRALAANQPIRNLVLGIIHPDREFPTWVQCDAYRVQDLKGNVQQVIVTFFDISERKRAEDALRESEAFVTTVLDNLPVGIAVNTVDPTVTFNYMNDNFARFYRTTREKLSDPNIFWNAVYEDADFRESIKKKILDDLASGDPERMVWVDVPITRKGESTSFITARNIPIPGKPLMISTIWDVTERKQAQEQLLKTLDELKRSNTELEQFAYVASHDLQEPLRAVAGMVQLLQQRYKGQLDGRADEYIGLAVEGATRMQTLINDLLAYSRVERRGSPIKSTDASAALQSALRNLGAAIFESGAVVTTGSLPTLDADATQLTQLFQNLIGNAIKFRGQDTPNIHVEARDLGEAWQFSVSDNGIGIEPQYYERIFLVFQRLHTRRDYPGTGIGLSICKKIVERHGGRIWVESAPGQGTTFHFTIPHRR